MGLDAGRLGHVLSRAVRWCTARRIGHLGAQWTFAPERAELARQAIRDATAQLAKCGRFREADHMARRGLEVFPQEKKFLTEHALGAHRPGHPTEAIDRRQQVLRHPAKDAISHARPAANLRKTNDPEHPQATIDHGPRGITRNIASLAQAARVAADSRGSSEMSLAGKLSKVSAGREVFVPDLPAHIEVVKDEAARQLLLRFEGIGDNCELALVQRRYGAEPLGLLRWNTVSFDQLVDAIRHRFRGMGDEANTEIGVASTGEFYVFDRRWSLAMHTFLYAGQTPKDALHKRMCRRVTYLRDKMLSDLVDAEKIFVYRSSGIDGNRLETLHHALREVGPVTLLAVQPAGSDLPFQGAPGDVLKIGNQRLVGFLSREGRDDQGTWDIAYEDWVSICRKTASID